jgi:hypothetical protein
VLAHFRSIEKELIARILFLKWRIETYGKPEKFAGDRRRTAIVQPLLSGL